MTRLQIGIRFVGLSLLAAGCVFTGMAIYAVHGLYQCCAGAHFVGMFGG